MRELDGSMEEEQEGDLVLEEVHDAVDDVAALGRTSSLSSSADAAGLSAGQLVMVQLFGAVAGYIICLPSAVRDARLVASRFAPSPSEASTCPLPLPLVRILRCCEQACMWDRACAHWNAHVDMFVRTYICEDVRPYHAGPN